LLLGLSLLATTARAAEVARDGDAWVVRSPAIEVRLTPGKNGQFTVRDRRANLTWTMPDKEVRDFQEVAPIADGLAVRMPLWTGGKPFPTTLRLTVPADDAATLVAEIAADDPETPVESALFLPPLARDADGLALAVADYANGHLYPLDRHPSPVRWLHGGRMDQPLLGVVGDGGTGAGYALILETPDDAVVECKAQRFGGRDLAAPWIFWHGQKGRFGDARRTRYTFLSAGGYVSVAKTYRAYAKDHGLLVTLAEKAKANPNVERLYGAVNVWGASSRFLDEARAAGVERAIFNGRHPRPVVERANALGYLAGEYDNYTDVEPIPPGGARDSTHDRIPETVVQEADGARKKAWLTYDGKTQFMKRCPALWVESAKDVVPQALAERPYSARFIDVTTAEDLYACYDPAHPLTQTEKRQCGVDLLGYVRSLGLVVGGEHGIWWSVPQLDYAEGMMSHNHSFAWPAGHLIRPKAKDETYTGPYKPSGTWETYARDGIGHETRIPLWELVFHDCIVTTWYWGDSTDFLSAVDPENWGRKDAFNVLYATMPMLWANGEGGWQTDRERAVRTCRVTGRLNRVLAPQEMLSHEWLTPDRALQRTRFADGTEVVVNFGDAPREATVGGAKYLLPKHGFAVAGPDVSQSLALVDGKPVLTLPEGTPGAR
jgi:hypothetical protein